MLKQLNKKLSMLRVVVPIVILILPLVAGAQGTCPPGQLCNPLGDVKTLDVLIGRFIRANLAILGILSLFAFVAAGTVFVASGGSPERVKKARDMMVYAAIGIGVALGSYVILSFVINQTLGVTT